MVRAFSPLRSGTRLGVTGHGQEFCGPVQGQSLRRGNVARAPNGEGPTDGVQYFVVRSREQACLTDEPERVLADQALTFFVRADRRRVHHPRATPAPRADQPVGLQFAIRAGHRANRQPQIPGKLTQGWQPIAAGQRPGGDQVGQLIPGVLLTGYGVVGLIMATTSAVAWVPVVSGVLSGVTLLAGSLLVLGSRRDLAQPRPGAVVPVIRTRRR
jgi:hypothetical protein